MSRRPTALRAAYLRSLARLAAARAEIAALQADLDDAIDALTPPCLVATRFATVLRVEDLVREATPLPPMAAHGLSLCIRWGRS